MTMFSPYFPIFLSLSVSFFFSFLLSNLINFFKNAHHLHLLLHFPSFLGVHGGLGRLTAIRHVIEKKLPPPPPATTKADLSDVVGVAEPVLLDGLASCTESLGFESSDESRVDDPIERVGDNDEDFFWRSAEGRGNWRRMENDVRNEVRSFPPPLSSLNPKGQPTFFLRPMRKNGRLELTEVRIRRPEILRVWRHDGRLTLFLIPNDGISEDLEDDREDESEQEQDEEEDEETAELEGEIGELEGDIGELEDKIEEAITEEKEEEEEEKEDEKEEEEEEEEEEEKEVGFEDKWKLRIGGNEGLRSCHEVVNRHRRTVLPVRHYRDHRHHNHPLHVCGLGIV